jgi:hypothetical protein
MGASVEVVPETTGITTQDFLTNTLGVFQGNHLAPGLYTVRVTLAGFLPTLEQHVRITAHLTTVVRLQLESMFASLDQLRRQPSATSVQTDDWKWVLRSASVTRPVLQWNEDGTPSVSNDTTDSSVFRPRARLDLTGGARRPGSVSNIPASPASAFAYDQKLGGTNRLILAGQMNYERSAPGGAVAAVWLPGGSPTSGSHTSLVLRQSILGPDGSTFRGVRIDQGGAVALGDRTLIRYGGEYVLVGLVKSAASLRPRLQMERQITENWRTALIFAAEPGAPTPLEQSALAGDNDALAAAMNELDAFPALLWRDGRPVLQGGWHEEMWAGRKLGTRGKFQMAAFHDDNRHIALFGRGSGLPPLEYLQDYLSHGFAYDGGSSSSWGTRVAFQQKLPADFELTAIYSFAGALSASELVDGPLREMLRTNMYHSLGANVSGQLPWSRTRFNAGYKWVGGTALSRIDSYGESLFQMDPFLHVAVRQSLPKFGPGRWEATANCDNLLAQGYVSLNSRDGRALLVPAFRTFRGGLSVQF